VKCHEPCIFFKRWEQGYGKDKNGKLHFGDKHE